MSEPELAVGQIWMRRRDGVKVVIRALHRFERSCDVRRQTIAKPRRRGACWDHNWHTRYQLSSAGKDAK